MLESIKKMGCGECEGEQFEVFTNGNSSEFHSQLLIQCVKCKKYTTFQPEKPRIQINWKEGDGNIAIVPR